MGRLTWKKEDGTWGLINADIKECPREFYGALCKLKDYEETGLEPDKIAEIDELYLEKCREVNGMKTEGGTKPNDERLFIEDKHGNRVEIKKINMLDNETNIVILKSDFVMREDRMEELEEKYTKKFGSKVVIIDAEFGEIYGAARKISEGRD